MARATGVRRTTTPTGSAAPGPGPAGSATAYSRGCRVQRAVEHVDEPVNRHEHEREKSARLHDG